MSFDIYGIINLINGKLYIGQSKQGYRKRFTQHCCPSDKQLLAKAIKKYGRENFSCELLDVVYTQDEADEAERRWIKALGTYKRENGYNLSMGGQVGEFNDEVRRKMSDDRKGEGNNFYGKRHTEESKRKMSEAHKAYGLAKHARAKMVKCVETGMVYECVRLAEIDTGINSHHIGQVANHCKGRETAGGCHWEWA